MEKKKIRILGIRGIPGAHGGFETFAEYLALYLVDRGWDVTVYCQIDGDGEVYEDMWCNIHRVHIPVTQKEPLDTMVFDWKSIRHAGRNPELTLVLGYNTAIFCLWLRIKKVPLLINMDGIEWKRQKWGKIAKMWFYLNDWIGCWLGRHLIADHPKIKAHLMTRVSEKKITMIPYGADKVSLAEQCDLQKYGLEPWGYITLIARAVPENSILEIVKGFSLKARGVKLVVVGNYDEANNDYHKQVKQSASDEVVFLGAIYDKEELHNLRYHSFAYVHGHQVGGTNPSLVEALGAGNPVIAHDNGFNRWVAESAAVYFKDVEHFDRLLEDLLVSSDKLEQMKEACLKRFEEAFTWEKVLADYEALLLSQHP